VTAAASKVSIAGVLRAFRRMLRDYLHPADPKHSLCALVRQAIVDDYYRAKKASCTDTRRKYEQPPGPPDIRYATRAQVKLAQQLAAERKRVNGVEWHPALVARANGV
jgi:hypothetical protein